MSESEEKRDSTITTLLYAVNSLEFQTLIRLSIFGVLIAEFFSVNIVQVVTKPGCKAWGCRFESPLDPLKRVVLVIL